MNLPTPGCVVYKIRRASHFFYAEFAMQRVALVSALAIAGLATTVAVADIPPIPRDVPAGKQYVSLQVTHDPDKDVSFLYLGRDAVRAGEPQAEQKTGWNPSPTRSIVAATALSLGIAGLFFMRGKRGAPIACGLVLAAGLGTLGTEAWGNAPAPPPPNRKYELDQVWNLTTAEGKKVFNGDTVVVIGPGRDVRLVIGTKPKPQRERRDPQDFFPPRPVNPGPSAPSPNAPAPIESKPAPK